MKKFAAAALAALLLGLTLLAAGCAPKQASVVIVGTEGAYPPYNFINDKGEVDGYDASVIKALDERIDEFSFKFEPTAWDAIFVALESGKFDIIASQIAKNPKREAAYLFAQQPYLYGRGAIIFKNGRTDISSIEDLHGKTVAAGVGSYNTTWLEEYNAANGDPITIEYYDGNVALMLQDIASGRVDATLNDPITTQLIIDEQGLDLTFVLRSDVDASPVYLLFANNENGKRYKEVIDKALNEIIQDGTLAKLSEQWFGADYTTAK